MQKPVDNLTWSAEDGEALIARVHLSDVPRADAEKVAWVIRRYFYVVCALQEAKLRVKRLRSLLFGKSPTPSPQASGAPSQVDGDGASAAAVLEADTAGAGVTVNQAPPGESPRPDRAKATGGPRPGTGRLGAAADAGATRVECRHEELTVGQRCPVCGQGNLYALPAGVAMRIDGNALLSAMHYAIEKRRGVRCDCYGGVAGRRGCRALQRPSPGGAGGEPVFPGGAGLSLARVPGDAGGAGTRGDAVGPDRGGG